MTTEVKKFKHYGIHNICKWGHVKIIAHKMGKWELQYLRPSTLLNLGGWWYVTHTCWNHS